MRQFAIWKHFQFIEINHLESRIFHQGVQGLWGEKIDMLVPVFFVKMQIGFVFQNHIFLWHFDVKDWIQVHGQADVQQKICWIGDVFQNIATDDQFVFVGLRLFFIDYFCAGNNVNR